MAALRNDSNITKIELFMLFPSYSGTLWCCSNKFRIDEIHTYSIRLEKVLSSQRKSMEFSVCSGEWNNSRRKRRGQSSPSCLSDALESFWASSWSRWDFRTEKFWSWAWKIWKWMHQICILEEWTQRKYWSDKMMNSYSQWQMVQRNCQEETTNSENHCKAGTDREEWRSQWRNSRRIGSVSTDRTNRWRWSPCWLLVDPKWLHLSSSQWTSSSALRAEGRNIPCSTEIHWRSEVYPHWSGCHARKTGRWLMECRFKQTCVRFLERIHKIHFSERNTSKRMYVVRRGTGRDPNNNQTRSCMARSFDENW